MFRYMVTILDGKEMTEEQLLQALRLDRQVYSREYWLDTSTALAYLHTCPEIYTYAVDGNELVAYLNMSFIDESSYITLLSGAQNDLCICSANLMSPRSGQKNNLYFSSIVVSPQYRGQGIARRLLARCGEKLAKLAQKGIIFSGVIADVVSPAGEKICRKLGMAFDKTTSRGSKIFGYRMDTGAPGTRMDSLINALKGEHYGQSIQI